VPEIVRFPAPGRQIVGTPYLSSQTPPRLPSRKSKRWKAVKIEVSENEGTGTFRGTGSGLDYNDSSTLGRLFDPDSDGHGAENPGEAAVDSMLARCPLAPVPEVLPGDVV
jgi:hypothetical protein